eukprot:3092762-Pleurochrysis_carterae.AAC.5
MQPSLSAAHATSQIGDDVRGRLSRALAVAPAAQASSETPRHAILSKEGASSVAAQGDCDEPREQLHLLCWA